MIRKAQFYISVLLLSAFVVMPVVTTAAPLPSAPESQAINGMDGSADQVTVKNENPALTIIQVTSTEDNSIINGNCTLREAIQSAISHSSVDACQAGSEIDNTITFAVTGTITLLAEDIDVNTTGGSLVIDGGGEITISGGGNVRVFSIGNMANVTLQNLSIVNGYAQDGGGIYNNGVISILNSTMSGNEASAGGGGGIYNSNTGSVNFANSTLSDNQAADGGGILSYGPLAITNSTLSGNHAQNDGGGVFSTGSFHVSNATIANNSTSDRGGGIFTEDDPLYLHNTILAENTAGVDGPDCYATTITTGGYNLIGNTAGCGISPWTGDLTNVGASLGPLQDNGGPTYTRALLPVSLAVNRGDRGGCSDYFGIPISTDQRGVPRQGRCDIGAYELQVEVAPAPYSVYLPSTLKSCPTRLYFDDFSNPNSGWKILENATGRYEYLNNEYRILAKVTPAWESSFPAFKAVDYVVTVDARNANGANGHIGILFSFAPDWSNFYFFVVNPNAHYIILEWNLQNSYWIASGYSNAIHRGTAVNRLKLERNGSMIWAYANGELLTIVKDEAFTGLGYVGLINVADTVPDVDARFDNFSVEPISCGASYNYPQAARDAYKLEIVDLAFPENWKGVLQDR